MAFFKNRTILGAALAAGLLLGAPSVPAAPPEPVAKPDKAQIQEAARAFREALGAGRKASKAKQYPQALAQFALAVKLDPNHAGALGEYGWAAYHDKQYDLAKRMTQRAIAASQEAKQLGALYYNLGRIAEDAGEAWLAADHYRRSLALRANDTVKERLAKVFTEIPTNKRVRAPKGFCPRAHEVYECTGPDCACAVSHELETEEAPSGGVPVTSAEGHLEIGKGVVLRAAIVTASGRTLGEYRDEILVVETGTGGWQWVDMIANEWNPGMFYIYNTGEVVSSEIVELSGCTDQGYGHGVLVRAKQSDRDGNYPDNIVEIQESEHAWLCAGDAAGISCASIRTSWRDSVEPMLDGEPVSDEAKGSLGVTAWSLDVQVKGGKIVIAKASGELPNEVQALLGTHDWPSLKGKPAVKVFPLR